MASEQRFELQTQALGAVPIVWPFLERVGLGTVLARWLPEPDPRALMPAWRAILVLVVNLCVSREPLYGICDWAARYDPAVLGLDVGELGLLSDDRVGRALDQLFDCDRGSLLTELVLVAIREFQIDCSQLHNDSISITLYGGAPRLLSRRVEREVDMT